VSTLLYGETIVKGFVLTDLTMHNVRQLEVMVNGITFYLGYLVYELGFVSIISISVH
jgi:hypothetical protein